MLTILNEELYSFNCIKGTDPKTRTPSYRLTISTSNKLVRAVRTQRNDRHARTSGNNVDIASNLETVTREILSVLTPSDDPTSYRNNPVSLRVGENPKGIPTVTIRCLGENDANKANIYVLAFPFNGMIKPIPEDPKYHIYKGIIATSVKPFFFNGRRYRKILYLVIEPHMALFKADHKYHTNNIPISIESYAIYKDKDTGEEKTNHETYTLDIVSEDGMYQETWDYETLDYPVQIESSPDTPVWHTFKFIQKDRPDTEQSGDHSPIPAPKPKKGNNGKKDGYVSGGMYVTTNRHGIRKEVPIGRKGKDHRDNDLDRMMRQSGMFDPKEDRRENYGKRGKKGGKGGKRNFRNDDY